jgi:hypothetical protein
MLLASRRLNLRGSLVSRTNECTRLFMDGASKLFYKERTTQVSDEQAGARDTGLPRILDE